MRLFSLALALFALAGCDRSTTLPEDASVDAATASDAAMADDTCTSFARPTGTCTAPGVCCVSSTCIDGICR